MPTAYVVTIGDTPTHSADTLETAQTAALTAERKSQGDRHEHRWDEYYAGRTWRLMQRPKGPAGKGRRFAWTQRAIHAVEHITT